MKFKLWLENQDYRGLHKAPNQENGSPLHDLSNTYPDDIYSDLGARYYGHGEPKLDRTSIQIIQKAHNQPDMPITIYRAVPKEIKEILAGDWVTINKQYAVTHGESSLQGNYSILTKIVPAKNLYTDGNSIHEWGYNP